MIPVIKQRASKTENEDKQFYNKEQAYKGLLMAAENLDLCALLALLNCVFGFSNSLLTTQISVFISFVREFFGTNMYIDQ
jgi:hypothetical protein